MTDTGRPPYEPPYEPPLQPYQPDAHAPMAPDEPVAASRRPRSLFGTAGADDREARFRQRPEPRLAVSLAGAGMALVIAGVLVWGGDYLEPGDRAEGGDNRELGVLLSLVTVALGYFLAARFRRGPLCTAGVVASAVGIPVLLGFLTWDSGGGGSEFGALTELVSLDMIVLVSVLAWLASYYLAPGGQGHAFYLGLAAVVLWLYLLETTEHLVSIGPLYLFFLGFFTDIPDIDWTNVAIVSLLFGGGYYVAAALLDRQGRHGMATALVLAAFPATLWGIVALADDSDATGVGLLLVVIGAVLCTWAATTPGRRFTTWAWAAAIAVGAVLVVGDLYGDNAAGGGFTLVLVGAAVVALAAVVRERSGEPDDMVLGPSRYPLVGSSQSVSPGPGSSPDAPPGAGSSGGGPWPGPGYPPPPAPFAPPAPAEPSPGSSPPGSPADADHLWRPPAP